MIPDLDKLHIEYKNSRNRTRKLLSKIKSLKKKYYFLERITRPRKPTDTKRDDTELEYAVMHLFEDLNFKCEKPKSDAHVDVKVRFKELYFGIEVKNGNYVGENESLQPYKHKLLNNDSFQPLLIYNNSLTNQTWDEPRKLIAEGARFGLLLTSELKKGYLKLKRNKITFNQFLNQLTICGEIKFSNSALGKAHKSD